MRYWTCAIGTEDANGVGIGIGGSITTISCPELVSLCDEVGMSAKDVHMAGAVVVAAAMSNLALTRERLPSMLRIAADVAWITGLSTRKKFESYGAKRRDGHGDSYNTEGSTSAKVVREVSRIQAR
jgi:hypothetical protein